MYVWLSHKSSTCHCHVCAYARYHTNPFFAHYLFSHLGSRAKKAPLQVKTGRMGGCKTSAVTDTTRVPLKLSYTGIQLTFILPPLSLSLPPSSLSLKGPCSCIAAHVFALNLGYWFWILFANEKRELLKQQRLH